MSTTEPPLNEQENAYSRLRPAAPGIISSPTGHLEDPRRKTNYHRTATATRRGAGPRIHHMVTLKKIRTLVLAGAAGAGLLVLPGNLPADTEATRGGGEASTSSTIETLRRQIAELDEKLRILERKQENADETNTAAFKAIPSIKADDKGLTVESRDKAYQFRLRGLLQTDFRSYLNTEQNNSAAAANNPDQNDGFVLRRVRPRFQGKLWENLTF